MPTKVLGMGFRPEALVTKSSPGVVLHMRLSVVGSFCQYDLLRMQESMATSIPQLARALPRRNIALDREGVAQYD